MGRARVVTCNHTLDGDGDPSRGLTELAAVCRGWPGWGAEIGFLDKRAPPPPLAAEGRLTLNT